jgi:CopG family nickel-responsive transcriptional regulator
MLERITISLDEQLAREFDESIRRKGYQNRSEAMRDMIRQTIEQGRLEQAEAPHCIAALSYVYNHHERELASRLTHIHHDHHDLNLSTMHVHLDHDNCMETVIMQGHTQAVRRFAGQVMAERGVRHGQLNLVPVDLHVEEHGGQAHVHAHPKT